MGLPLESETSSVILSPCQVKKYEEMKKNLEEEIEIRNLKLQNLFVTLEALQEELAVPIKDRDLKSIIEIVDQEVDSSVVSQFSLSDVTFSNIEKEIQNLMNIRSKREQVVRQYALQIKKLWHQLQVSEYHKERFFNQTTLLGPDVEAIVTHTF